MNDAKISRMQREYEDAWERLNDELYYAGDDESDVDFEPEIEEDEAVVADARSDEARFIREVQSATGIPTWAAPTYRRAGR